MRYIKLSTEICKWEWFTDGNMLKLWIYLLTNAQQFKETRYQGLVIQRGQVIIGRKKLAKELKMSEQQIRSCINRLKSTNEITTKSTNKYTLITIVKYDKYQTNLTDINQQNNQVLNQRATNKQPTNNQQITTSNKDKREREKESNYIYSTRFIKPSIEEIELYCIERQNNVDPNRFYNYYESNGWKVGKNPMKDWKACIRTWERNNITPKIQEDELPKYDASNNPKLSSEQLNELLALRRS